MSLQISKNLLEKINSLYQNISLDGEISSIERDLMLSYTRQFYEAILSESNTKPEIPVAPKVVTPPPVVIEVIAPTPPAAPVVAEVKTIPVPPPIELVVTAPSAAREEVAPAPHTPKPAPVIVEQPISVPKPMIERPAVARPVTSKPLIKPSVERVESNQLFEEKMSKELSDKLGELPIADIKKAMSLNERIIFVNELFDGNFTEFENALTNLNSVNDFAEAKGLMEILATRFDWSSKEKQAKTLIKLVKRRYP